MTETEPGDISRKDIPSLQLVEIPSSELHEIASRLVEHSPAKGALDTGKFHEWVSARMHGLRFKGVNVLTVDWDCLYEPKMDSTLTSLVQSPDVKGVIVEYFTPELSQKAQNVPIVGKKLSALVEHMATDMKKIEGNAKYGNQYNRRLHFAKEMSDTLSEGSNPVICFDIANKPLYLYMREMSLFAESFVGGVAGAIVARGLNRYLKMNPGFRPITTMAGITVGAQIPFYLRFWQMGMQSFRKGMYDPEKVSAIEQFQPHLEDARRLVISEGLLQHIDRVAQEQSGGEKTYLMVYPRAHNVRVRNYMKRIIARDASWPLKVKDMAYRLVSDPILDFQARTFQFSGDTWVKQSTHKIHRMV